MYEEGVSGERYGAMCRPHIYRAENLTVTYKNCSRAQTSDNYLFLRYRMNIFSFHFTPYSGGFRAKGSKRLSVGRRDEVQLKTSE